MFILSSIFVLLPACTVHVCKSCSQTLPISQNKVLPGVLSNLRGVGLLRKECVLHPGCELSDGLDYCMVYVCMVYISLRRLQNLFWDS